MWKNIKEMLGIAAAVIVLLLIWLAIVGGALELWPVAISVPLVVMIIYYAVKLRSNCWSYGYDATKKRKKVSDNFYLKDGEFTLRIVTQVAAIVYILLWVLAYSFNLGQVVFLGTVVMLVFAIWLSSCDYSVFKSGGEFFETKRYSYTSDSTYDVKYDAKKQQIHVSQHTESGVDFDGMRVTLFIMSLIANVCLPVVGLIIKRYYLKKYCKK